MSQVCTIGMDIAKNKFQVHGEDAHGHKVFNKQLNRLDVLLRQWRKSTRLRELSEMFLPEVLSITMNFCKHKNNAADTPLAIQHF